MAECNIELIAARLGDRDPEIQANALQALHNEIKSTQGTIVARTQELLDIQERIAGCLNGMSGENALHLCDLLSVMCVLDDSSKALHYRLMGNITDLSEWSHQYVKKLVKCIVDITNGEAEAENYEVLIEPIVRFLLHHNSEVEAIDFIVEVSYIPGINGNGRGVSAFSRAIKSITAEETSDGSTDASKKKSHPRADPELRYFDLIIQAADSDNRDRILIYLEELSKFYALEDVLIRINAYDPSRYLVCLIKHGRVGEAMEYVRDMEDPRVKKQCLYILARNSIYYKGGEEEEYILTNNHVKEVFSGVAASLEVLPPKKLEYMFKGLNKDRIDTASIANSLVHFAYGRDPVFFPQNGDFKIKEEYSEQLKINKSISTMASVGLINAFDPSSVYDFYSSQIFNSPEIGAVLALALSSCKVRDTNSSILNLLSIFLSSGEFKDVIAALLGISVLYAGKEDQEAYNLVFPLLSSPDNNVGLFSIFVLGCVFPGDMEILSSCLDVYKELKKETSFSNFAILGIALFFYKIPFEIGKALEMEDDGEISAEDEQGIGKQSSLTRARMEQFKRLDKHSKILALGFMHIGTGDSSIIDMIFSKAFVGEIDALLESLGLLSCCLVGIGDNVTTYLLDRISTSSLLLDSPHLRNIVPLCMALLYASNPKTEIVDILEKCINSGEANVNSLVGIGIVGAGSCSSRILRILDSNFGNVYKDSKASAALIYSQGLLNLGKGLFTLSPLCYDSQIILHKSVVGLISTFFVFLESGMFKEYPFLLYLIAGAVSPKYVAGFEGIVKVGKPVDVVGLVGRPNKISASIVHSLPVILNENERAESEVPVYTAYIEDILVKK